jgi:hypothetical protein
MFGTVGGADWHAAPIPAWHSLDLRALGLFVLAAGLMLGLGRPILQSIALMALAGIGLGLI